MADNYKISGDRLPLPAPYALTTGQGAKIGSLFGVALNNAASGATSEFATCGVWALPKVSALAIAVGDPLYWDNAARLVNKTAAGNLPIGVAVSAAGNPSATVNVLLVPAAAAAT